MWPASVSASAQQRVSWGTVPQDDYHLSTPQSLCLYLLYRIFHRYLPSTYGTMVTLHEDLPRTGFNRRDVTDPNFTIDEAYVTFNCTSEILVLFIPTAACLPNARSTCKIAPIYFQKSSHSSSALLTHCFILNPEGPSARSYPWRRYVFEFYFQHRVRASVVGGGVLLPSVATDLSVCCLRCCCNGTLYLGAQSYMCNVVVLLILLDLLSWLRSTLIV